MNSGVWVKGSNYNDDEDDYYGLIEEIIQLEYPGIHPKNVVLFKCKWFDPKSGMRKHNKYDLVDVNPKRIYRTNGPFILAQEAIQVYYATYPGARRDRANWQAVCKIKARSTIDQRWIDKEDAYQPEELVSAPIIDEDIIENLGDPSGGDEDGADVPIQEDVDEIIGASSSDEEDTNQDENHDDRFEEEEEDF